MVGVGCCPSGHGITSLHPLIDSAPNANLFARLLGECILVILLPMFYHCEAVKPCEWGWVSLPQRRRQSWPASGWWEPEAALARVAAKPG